MLDCNSSSSIAWDDTAPISHPTKRRVVRRFPTQARAERAREDSLIGVAITPQVSARTQQRRIFDGVVARFCAEGYVSRTSMHAAQCFVEALPSSKDLPKVSPDGEGGVTLAWAVPNDGRTLITLVDWIAYGVARAGTDEAMYLNDAPFEGVVIPEELLNVIPG